MVLDELDSGLGGRLGKPVAQTLRRMLASPGAASQILCVSHLPQVRISCAEHCKNATGLWSLGCCTLKMLQREGDSRLLRGTQADPLDLLLV